MSWELDDRLPLNRGGTPGDGDSGDYYTDTAKALLNQHAPLIQPFSGQFLLDPNEVNAWATLGPNDQSMTGDIGDVTALNAAGTLGSNNFGGFIAPYDMKLTEFCAIHDNSNGSALAWGWVIFHVSFTLNSNAEVATLILNEAAGNVGLRDYADSFKQKTLVTLTDSDQPGGPPLNDITIPRGDMVTLGVAAPTAFSTNYYVRVAGGYMRFERV